MAMRIHISLSTVVGGPHSAFQCARRSLKPARNITPKIFLEVELSEGNHTLTSFLERLPARQMLCKLSTFLRYHPETKLIHDYTGCGIRFGRPSNCELQRVRRLGGAPVLKHLGAEDSKSATEKQHSSKEEKTETCTTSLAVL